MKLSPASVETPDALLRRAAGVFVERNAAYGAAYLTFGKALKGLMGDSVTLRTEEEFGRFALVVMSLGKLHRYATNLSRGGHEDSAVDLSAYAAMLRHFDALCVARQKSDHTVEENR